MSDRGVTPAGITFADRAVYVEDHATLVLADLHVGRDAASNVQARLGEHEDLLDRFEALCERFAPERVVFAGDLLHSFSTLPRGVMETVAGLESVATAAGASLVVTPGNHDSMLGSVWDGPTETEHRVGRWVVCHGHEPPTTDAAGYVVGHEHPTIVIEGVRRPCYLYGTGVYDGTDVLMLPAFTRLAAGVPVDRLSAEGCRSPLVRDLDSFRPVVRDEAAGETLGFPPLGRFREML
jgi:putative SbcD/Mre11-related phosphoesterase